MTNEPLASATLLDHTGWLVEENASGIIHWIALEADSWPRYKEIRLERRPRGGVQEKYLTPVRRVKDANEALRFARREDAEAFIKLFDRFLLFPVATEHCWPSHPLASATLEAVARVRVRIGFAENSDWADVLVADLRTILDALTARTFTDGDVERVAREIDQAADLSDTLRDEMRADGDFIAMARAALAALQYPIPALP